MPTIRTSVTWTETEQAMLACLDAARHATYLANAADTGLGSTRKFAIQGSADSTGDDVGVYGHLDRGYELALSIFLDYTGLTLVNKDLDREDLRREITDGAMDNSPDLKAVSRTIESMIANGAVYSD